MKKNLLFTILFFVAITGKGQVFFSEDFGSGIPGGWTNIDQSGNNILWRVTTTGSHNGSALVDSLLNPAGTTAANGYLIMDSDSAGQAFTEDSYLTTAAINCTSHSNVHLLFNEYFAQYLASTGIVSVSNDNVNWTVVHQAHLGLQLNESTPNPYAVDLDITSVAGGQATVYVRFYYHGEWDYWWYVDDLQLYEAPPTDLSSFDIKNLNNEYTLIPFVQATNLTLQGTVKNIGSASATGGTVLFEVVNTTSSQTVFSETINLPVITSGSLQTVTPTTAFVPTSAGSYISRITVSIAGDGNSGNNMMESAPLELSDSVYARDDDNFAGTLGIGAGPGQDAIMGQNFRVNTTDNLSSITFFMDEGFAVQPNGTPVYFTVHSQTDSTINPDGSNALAYSDTILFTPGMIPSGGAYYTVPIQGGAVQLFPGLYFIGIHETDSELTIGYSNAIFTPYAVWVHWSTIPPPAVNGWAPAEAFSSEVAYMIRANFGNGSVGLENIQNDISLFVYPNPVSEKVYVRLSGFEEKSPCNYKLFDMQGRIKSEGELEQNKTHQIDLNNKASGIYNLVVYTSKGVVTKKITVVE